jgi:hypothetical protein
MSNSFCGPFAVSHALSIPIKDATAKIREITGKRAVFGVAHSVMDALFTRVYEKRDGAKVVTVRDFYLSHEAGVYVLAIRGHYLVLDGSRIYDNHGTARVDLHYQARKWVQMAWFVRSDYTGAAN